MCCRTTQTSITVDTTCPINTGVGQNDNDTVTWGIEYYKYQNCATGTVTFGNYTTGDGDSMEQVRGLPSLDPHFSGMLCLS